MIKSTKATKIYRDDRTFTLTFLKLEIFFPKEKQDVVSESFLGWGRGRNKKKKLIIPFILILKVFIFVVVVVLICGRKEEFF